MFEEETGFSGSKLYFKSLWCNGGRLETEATQTTLPLAETPAKQARESADPVSIERMNDLVFFINLRAMQFRSHSIWEY